MWQRITIVGNLGSDPEMRYTPSGVPVTSFSVAVNRKVKLQDGSLLLADDGANVIYRISYSKGK